MLSASSYEVTRRKLTANRVDLPADVGWVSALTGIASVPVDGPVGIKWAHTRGVIELRDLLADAAAVPPHF